MKNKFKSLIAILFIALPLIGCSEKNEKDIVILYTSDVHCGIDDNIGYASLSAYKKELEKNNYVTLMDAGDAISGDFIGAISKGEYVIDIMNEVGYDSMIFGNHEFDYGMDILSERVKQFNGDVLSSNFKYIGKKENKFNNVKNHKIIEYGQRKVGYIGVSTPYTIVDSTPSYFMEDGEFAYSFSGDTSQQFYNTVQNSINACLNEKADFIVLLTHLGDGEQYGEFSSPNLIKSIKGADIILDGHAHKNITKTVIDKEGKQRPLLEPGYKMNNVGQITISKDNLITAKLVDDVPSKDEHIVSFIDSINAKVEEKASKVMATSDIALQMSSVEGLSRMTRAREMPIGNLVSDAYRIVSEAQIGITNGGAIRSNLKEGQLTYSDIMALHPFGNTIDVIEASGEQIADYLEFASAKTEKEFYSIDAEGKKSPLGESGAFAHVSGLKYTIDTDIPSSVVVDDKAIFSSINGERRVKDILVLENNTYVPLDLNKKYTVCSHNYLLEEGGDGATMFKDCPIVKKDLMLDYEILVKYIVDELNGHLKDKYSVTEGRITVI